MLYGMGTMYITANNNDNGSHNATAQNWYYTQGVSIVALAAFTVNFLVNLGIYVYQASRDTPIMTPKKPATSPTLSAAETTSTSSTQPKPDS
jgi:hypothetical protein